MGFLTRILHLKEREKPLKKVIADFDSDDLQDAIEMLDGLGNNSRDKLFISVVVLTFERVDFKDVQIKGDPNMAMNALCRLRPGE